MIKFLNRFYYPDEEERKRLEKLQEFLHFANVEFYFTYRHLNPNDVKRRKELVHVQARQRLGIVKKKETHPPEEV